jgi:hypothetical protein
VKPPGPVARRGDYVIEPCAHADAAALVREHHYAKSAANTSAHAHCLRRVADGAIVGAALWMPPTAGAAKGLAKKHLGTPERHREVLVLSRLVVAPGEPKNVAGLLLGASERLVRRDPRWALLVTYADTARHPGTIYRATNWAPDGETKPATVWKCGGVVRSAVVTGRSGGRSGRGRVTRSASAAEMRAMGCEPAGKSIKARFVKRIRP